MKLSNQNETPFEVHAVPTYIPEESQPEQQQFFFSYHIKIQNKSSLTAQLLSRHWIITDSFGRIEEVRGPGVVGLQPKIKPGECFEYESACPLPTSTGSMKGSFFMINENGEKFTLDVSEFYLIAPQALH